jgi:hypothetical protein
MRIERDPKNIPLPAKLLLDSDNKENESGDRNSREETTKKYREQWSKKYGDGVEEREKARDKTSIYLPE